MLLNEQTGNEAGPGRFFLEAGALDSEEFSTTLLLELERGWTGLLVEPLPFLQAVGMEKNRRAWQVQTCLATQTRWAESTPLYIL